MIFTIFDITIISIIALSSILGLYKGFINLSIGIAAFVLSIIIAYFLYPAFLHLANNYIQNPLGLSVTSIVASYLIALIVCNIVSNKLKAWSCGVSGGLIDKSLGAIAGFIRGGLFAIIIFIIIGIITTTSYIDAHRHIDLIINIDKSKYPQWLKDSLITEYFDMAISNILHVYECPE